MRFLTWLFVLLPLALKAGPTPLPSDQEGDWIELFDGKSLDGWEIKGGTGQYKVEDDAIVGYGENIRGNTFLCTKERFGDFILSYDFKFDDPRGNSGVMFRANQKPSDDGSGRVFGYQCEGDNGRKRAWTAGLYDEARRGWLFPTKAKNDGARREWFSAIGKSKFNWEGWNTIVIRCQGNHIQTWLNGVKRVDFVDTDPKHDTREGFIGLQVHSGKHFQARWKNIRLKKL